MAADSGSGGGERVPAPPRPAMAAYGLCACAGRQHWGGAARRRVPIGREAATPRPTALPLVRYLLRPAPPRAVPLREVAPLPAAWSAPPEVPLFPYGNRMGLRVAMATAGCSTASRPRSPFPWQRGSDRPKEPRFAPNSAPNSPNPRRSAQSCPNSNGFRPHFSKHHKFSPEFLNFPQICPIPSVGPKLPQSAQIQPRFPTIHPILSKYSEFGPKFPPIIPFFFPQFG